MESGRNAVYLTVLTASLFTFVWLSGGRLALPSAEACGLGATSCFKCHNGKKAVKPSGKAWHTDHARVNYTCPTCHGGSPWKKAKASAHKGPKGFRGDPRKDEKASCGKCHTEGVPKSYPTSEKSSDDKKSESLQGGDSGVGMKIAGLNPVHDECDTGKTTSLN
ncbi:MAG: hypothetical protein IEMM0002_1555 [bacterium]|nr:MAG: hypothetical protein IEMM0002_1555 [bacterium]